VMGGHDGSDGLGLAIDFLPMSQAHCTQSVFLRKINGTPIAANVTFDFDAVDIDEMATAVFVVTDHAQSNLRLPARHC